MTDDHVSNCNLHGPMDGVEALLDSLRWWSSILQFLYCLSGLPICWLETRGKANAGDAITKGLYNANLHSARIKDCSGNLPYLLGLADSHDPPNCSFASDTSTYR
jgi:hypothetical protein